MVSRYAVLLDEFGALAPDTLAPIFEAALGMVRFDAIRRAREVGGFLAERLDGPVADALVDACAAAGATAHRVPQDAVFQVGKPLVSRLLRCDDDAFRVTVGYTGAPRVLPWGGVRLLSAAVLTERSAGPAASGLGQRRKKRMGFGKRMMLNSVLPGLGSVMAASANRRARRDERADERRTASSAREARDIEVADAFAADADGTLLHLRWRAPDLYYGDILGPARRGDVAADFRQVVAAIFAQATDALVTPALQALLAPGEDAGVDAAEAAFDSEHAFGEYNRWQLQLLELNAG